MKKVYISGQISGLSQEEYHTNFGLAEAYLESIDHKPVNPLKIMACETEECAPSDSKKEDGSYLHDYGCYMKFDILALLDCDAIMMLPNWENSRGAQVELAVAEACGLEIFWYNNPIVEGDTDGE